VISASFQQYMIESLAKIPVEVEYASEFRYRNPIIHPDDVVIVISQSGETADTLEAAKISKQKGALTLGFVNVVGSSIARATDAGVYLHVGPEIGVASTKAFSGQIMILALFSVQLGLTVGTLLVFFSLHLVVHLCNAFHQKDGKRTLTASESNCALRLPDRVNVQTNLSWP